MLDNLQVDAAAGMVQAEAAGLEERGECVDVSVGGTRRLMTEDGDGEVGVWGFKALEVGGDVGLQRNGKWWTARTSRQTFSPLRSLCQSARTAGISEEEAPTLGSILSHCVTFSPPRG